jgi:hypothetical protein
MKIIDLGHAHPTLDEVMSLAQAELVVLRKPDGSVFALSPVDDFDVEVELLKNNPEFMAFLGYPLKAGQLTYDCRYSTMHGMPVTGGRGFGGLKPLWYNSVPP